MTGNRQISFAKRSLGQNFLYDQNFISRIVSDVEPRPGELVIEIGPGRGAITRKLVLSGAQIIAAEIDGDLAELLNREFVGADNLRVHVADAVEIDFASLVPAGGRAKLVANLPYYISTAILQRLIEQRQLFSSMTLMFQREVVERLIARPGDSERGFLTVLAQSFLEIRRLFDVPPTAFRPQPKIWSSVVRLTPKAEPVGVESESDFRKLLSRSFSHKRKTLHNNLKAYYGDPTGILAAAAIDGSRRAETLTNEEWLRLYGAIPEEND